MKLHARSAAWLLPFFLTACLHTKSSRQVQPPPPLVHGPPPAIEYVILDATIPTEHLELDTTLTAHPNPRPVRRRPPESGNSNIEPANSANTQQAPNQDSAVSVLGQLSSGDSSDLRKETVDAITAIERGLNTRKLNGQQLKTAAQIREYLKQARTALASGDMDGAHTLAAKAKLLFSELNF